MKPARGTRSSADCLIDPAAPVAAPVPAQPNRPSNNSTFSPTAASASRRIRKTIGPRSSPLPESWSGVSENTEGDSINSSSGGSGADSGSNRAENTHQNSPRCEPCLEQYSASGKRSGKPTLGVRGNHRSPYRHTGLSESRLETKKKFPQDSWGEFNITEKHQSFSNICEIFPVSRKSENLNGTSASVNPLASPDCYPLCKDTPYQRGGFNQGTDQNKHNNSPISERTSPCLYYTSNVNNFQFDTDDDNTVGSTDLKENITQDCFHVCDTVLTSELFLGRDGKDSVSDHLSVDTENLANTCNDTADKGVSLRSVTQQTDVELQSNKTDTKEHRRQCGCRDSLFSSSAASTIQESVTSDVRTPGSPSSVTLGETRPEPETQRGHNPGASSCTVSEVNWTSEVLSDSLQSIISCKALHLHQKRYYRSPSTLTMVATSSSQQTIYRSVPPRPLSYGLSDMLDPRSLGYLGGRHRSSTAHVSGNTPEEFAHRFKARPTTRPRVIEFDGSSVTPKGHQVRHHHSAMSNGFPTARAKIYIGQPKARSPSDLAEHNPSASALSSRHQHPPGRLHLTPLHSSPSILVGGAGGGSSTTTHSSHSYHISHASPSPAPLPAAHVTHKTLQGQQSQQQQQQQRGERTGPAASVGFSGSANGSAKTTHNPSCSGAAASTNTKSNSSARMLSKSASSLGQQAEVSGGRSSTSALKLSENFRESSHSMDLMASMTHDIQSDMSDYIHNPELLLISSADCDDLCTLPPPKKVLPKRELPWVFRYKVKRGMNTLSKIMASKPPQNLLHSSQAFT